MSKISVEFSIKEHLILCFNSLLILCERDVNVRVMGISYLPFAFLLHAYYIFTAILQLFFFFLKIIIQQCMKRVEKKIHGFLSSFTDIYIYLQSWLYFRINLYTRKKRNERFLTDFPKSRSSLKREKWWRKYLCSPFQVRWLERGRS